MGCILGSRFSINAPLPFFFQIFRLDWIGCDNEICFTFWCTHFETSFPCVSPKIRTNWALSCRVHDHILGMEKLHLAFTYIKNHPLNPTPMSVGYGRFHRPHVLIKFYDDYDAVSEHIPCGRQTDGQCWVFYYGMRCTMGPEPEKGVGGYITTSKPVILYVGVMIDLKINEKNFSVSFARKKLDIGNSRYSGKLLVTEIVRSTLL